MQYTQVSFSCRPSSEIVSDILAAQLADIGFESFVESPQGIEAYVQTNLFSKEKIDDIVNNFPIDTEITYSVNDVEDQNWNEEWEKHYFQPIVIDNRCLIRSSFHKPDNDNKYDYTIVIDPKMSFGTGHHQTTGLVLQQILEMDLQNKSVLDMGAGTAVLAILAAMRGASRMLAIDIDQWACENAIENAKLNNISEIRVRQGGAETLDSETFDVVFANINRNILLNDIPAYNRVINPNGTLIVSGFYKEDLPMITDKCKECGMSLVSSREQDNWVAAVYSKN